MGLPASAVIFDHSFLDRSFKERELGLLWQKSWFRGLASRIGCGEGVAWGRGMFITVHFRAVVNHGVD